MSRTDKRMRLHLTSLQMLVFAIVVSTGASGYPPNAQAQVQIPDLILHLNIPGVEVQPMGDTLPLLALHVYRDGYMEKATRRLQWQSSNKNVASVDEQGLVHFTGRPGTAIVTVSDGRMNDRIELVCRSQGMPQVAVYRQKGERYQLVNKAIAGMTLDEKIGQMMMPNFRRAEGQHAATLAPEIAETIRKHHIGGVILFREDAASTEQTIRLVQAYQQAAQKYGLLVAIDQEGGIVSRLQQGTDLPGNMALGAARSKALAWKAGDVIGSELASLGINTDFAPDLDVNSNPDNPVIGVRSFGEDPQLVGELGVAYMRGLQHNGIIAALKHFPGHGDTAVDSHLGLPQVPYDLEHLAKTELISFKQAIAAGADAIMTAHVTFPKVEYRAAISKKDGSKIALPATLSPAIITGLLREKLGFDGVIFTDAMNMQAIADHFGQTDAAILAIQAGVDIVLMPMNLEKVIQSVCEAVKKGQIAESRIDQSVRRILTLKIRRGILKEEDPETLEARQIRAQEVVGSPAHKRVENEIAARSITLVKNNGVLPLQLAESQKLVVVGADYVDELAAALAKHHARTAAIRIGKKGLTAEQWGQVQQADAVILASCTADARGRSADAPAMKLYRQITEQTYKPVISVGIRNPYDVMAYPAADAYLAQYGYRPASFAAMADTIFGWNVPTGKLPVTIPDGKGGILYPYGHGLTFAPRS
ncbi:glycoside hydrolase family 3 N-terminal domain-containing protein [Brevibacillus sp. GCM10020057]|uniref:glycoside hydrolase family 3 N-terminal domain-containing protein n=1 Tax=Brevibacillus sp. GCM10020057 TaxID=3317327 RepID=UPI00362892F2